MLDETKSWKADTLSEQIAVKLVAENEYISLFPPGAMGNRKPIAYGGCTTAVALNAACQTVKPGFHLYSTLGYFLGPALTDRHVKCYVHHSRDTKTFATRRVVLSQMLDNGTDRKCLELIADFQAKEKAAAMEFSPPTQRKYQHPTESESTSQMRNRFFKEGKITKENVELFDQMFALNSRFFEQGVAEGVGSQNCLGFVKDHPTDQDHLHITEKFSAEWWRAKHPLKTEAEQMAALGFNMDGGLSFIPLIHDHKYLEDVGACSSLDFALRVFTDNLDLTKWHVKERKTIAGHGGRTYSEAKLFDEAGQLVAIESQQSIMRPLPSGAVAKL